MTAASDSPFKSSNNGLLIYRAAEGYSGIFSSLFFDIKDEMIGESGTLERELYERELQVEILGEMIRMAREKQNLTQEELGKLIGVQKAQISKLERNTNNV
ncbi:MAG: helix-turn-helix domain-containing protein, partial [Bacteroidota bacterium]